MQNVNKNSREDNTLTEMEGAPKLLQEELHNCSYTAPKELFSGSENLIGTKQ